MSRVLILTAGFGEGHHAAARNLAAAFDQLHGNRTALIVDLFAQTSPRLNALTRRAYLAAINRAPRWWSALYSWIDRAHPLPGALGFFRGEMRLLDQIIRRENPVAICSTYPVFAFLLEKLTADGRLAVPYYNIVTDSISINSLWWLPSCHGWFLPNKESAEIVREAGRPTARLHSLGFPVPSIFTELSGKILPPNLAAGHSPRVLYIVNSGSQDAATTAHLLLAESAWEITCAVGRNSRLRRQLERVAADRRTPTTILGWTDQIPQLMMSHHAVVSKAGGATTQEAIAARCPMIVNQIIPGQEEGNYELLRRHGIGALADEPLQVIRALRLAFAQHGTVWREWRRSLDQLSRPTAAADIARTILPLHAASTADALPPATLAALFTRHG